MNAVVDRKSDGIAVLLFGNEEYQVNLPVEFLPEGTRAVVRAHRPKRAAQ